MSTPRPTSADRMRRILAIVPWIAARDGPTIDEVCERFSISQAELLADLEVVFMVGVPPYTPDALIDVVTEDGRVWVRLGDYFRRPVRLTPPQALALVAAGGAVLGTPGADTEGPLARALTKINRLLGSQEDLPVAVQLGEVPAAILDVVQDALARGRRLELDYWSYGRDERTVRLVDPARVWAHDGAWYLAGWCHTAGGERVFRLDRIAAARCLDDQPADWLADTASGGDAPYTANEHDHRITLELDPDAAWVAERFAVDSVDRTGGRLLVTLPVSSDSFLVRLLLRLGPQGRIVAVDGNGDPAALAPWEAQVAEAARAILRRYEGGGAEGPEA